MKSILLACLSILVLASCGKKEIKELPPATQTGANTFGLKINGEMWVPQGFAGISADNLLVGRLLGDVVVITAQNFASSPTETEFEIRIFGVTGPGTYLLNTNTTYPNGPTSFGYHVKRRVNPLDEWITTANQTGSVTITKLDTAAHIMSGTFQFNAENDVDPSKTISVTEGRFDIKY